AWRVENGNGMAIRRNVAHSPFICATRSLRPLKPATRGPIHVPFVGRSNPISERLVLLATESSDPEQAVFHQVTIPLCDGTSDAESPKAIQRLCSCAGQLGPRQ